jgi:[acyl-carrier-protein] S-malonyltransferase
MTRAILFPGQGAQHVGMGREFHAASAAARALFERADRVLGIELTRFCFEGPEEKLAATDICQPAIFVCSAAIVAALEERGGFHRADFAAAAGLSLGEYTALWFAGALEFDDALRLVRTRGEAMQRASLASPSGMLALLGASEAQAQAACDRHRGSDVLQPANYLGPGNIAVSGSKPALERLAAHAREDGIRRAIPLKVAGAFHSPLMQPAVAELEAAFARVQISPPRIPVWSNVTAEPHGSLPELRATLMRQVTAPVLWERSVRAIVARGMHEFFEPGPGAVLSGLVGKIEPTAQCRNVQKPEDLERSSSEGGRA